MPKNPAATPQTPPKNHATLASYILGFAFSLYLTLTAYFLVVDHALGNTALVALLAALALAQFIVQMLFFLHLGRETRPRWKLVVFIAMLMIVLILVAGSIWIMNNLNYHMTPQQINNYLNSQDGF